MGNDRDLFISLPVWVQMKNQIKSNVYDYITYGACINTAKTQYNLFFCLSTLRFKVLLNSRESKFLR